MNPRLTHFNPGDSGTWKIREIRSILGATLPLVNCLEISNEEPSVAGPWLLRGIPSNRRYATREEDDQLLAKQEGLGRPTSTCAALIPIKKSNAWWLLSQDERRAIFEEQSHHTKVGLNYLPAVARKLYHCRDLSSDEPFDFLTWFEYEPQHEADFDRLCGELRKSTEWSYVEREVDIRLYR